jgi:type I restriction enzyme R subunit
MKELDLQDKYVLDFLCKRADGLGYQEVKANTVSPQFFITEDLRRFLAETSLNEKSYKQLLAKYPDEKTLLAALLAFLNQRIGESANMAVFFHTNKSVTFEGHKLYLFYPSGGITDASDKLFTENIFSVVQELPYAYKHGGSTRFSFRPDLTFFLNGMYLGYSELKSNYNNQTAAKNGRRKVGKDYLTAAQAYLKLAAGNDASQSIRREFLKIFDKAIHVTSTDLHETYIIRNLAQQLEELKTVAAGEVDGTKFQESLEKDFKPYPLRQPKGTIRGRFEEVFRALYSKRMIEKEILYYNFLERELVRKDGSKQKEYKHNDGRLISPRPKQKFGTDKVIDKIDELLAHEAEPDYFINQLRQQLKALKVGDVPAQELIDQRLKYHNNKYVYSLLLQYAAGFGKSNIIGWLALQLKDLRRKGAYVYDKILLVVDRLQLRDQLDTKMHNLNIQKSMFVEADSKAAFLDALKGDTRIVVVNLQKFGQVAEALPPEVLQKLAGLRVAFLIDEIHRSNNGEQSAAMLDLFEELQTALDKSAQAQPSGKKNLLVGFTATPSSRTLARFGEFAHYAENKALWVPFDSYTMKEAIADGFILNPLTGVVPVSAKMYFELPENELAGFEGDTGYEIPDDTDTGVDAEGRRYAIRKKGIYANEERIQAVAQFVVERLVASVYPHIRGTAKAMLAVSSIPNAIKYKKHVSEAYQALIKANKKYERFEKAPIYIVYSNNQEYPAASTLNDGLSEAQVLQNFAIQKNGLLIVVDKLQTGFDEPKLHTLFLDKEIRDINAIQTISRVNRKIKYKNDCKIIDFSYKNVNVRNIKDAFEKFSNVVVSDFDPLGSEQQLAVHYDDLREHSLYEAHFAPYLHYQQHLGDITPILDMEQGFVSYIKNEPEAAKKLKVKIGKYFRILNLIEHVLDFDPKLSEEHFLRFWRRYNNEYNSLHRLTNAADDVEIYFDNQLGIVAPAEEAAAKAKGQLSIVSEDMAPFGKKYKYSILRVIEKRNQQEDAIEALIKDFEQKIDALFSFIRTDDDGKRIVAKMQSISAHFDPDEIYEDFAKVYRKFVRRNKADVGEFFIRETKDIINQLCDDFEKLY